MELKLVEPLDPIFVNNATFLVHKETLKGNKAAKFVDVTATTQGLLET